MVLPMGIAIAVRLTEMTWQVYCHDCRADLGTMSSEGLQRALVATAKRGGVMCPECRRHSCKNCYIVPRKKLSENGLCIFCEWEGEPGGEKTQAVDIACLVDHKSRNPRERE